MFLPQMAPTWWTLLMMMFLMSFIVYMSLLYFNNTNYPKINKKYTLKNMNWTW